MNLGEAVNKMDDIKELLDLKDSEIKSLYNSWDNGDCSLVGIVEIYLYQCIKEHKQNNDIHYDTDYDNIHLRYGQQLNKNDVVNRNYTHSDMKKSFVEGSNRGCYIASVIHGNPIDVFDTWDEFMKRNYSNEK